MPVSFNADAGVYDLLGKSIAQWGLFSVETFMNFPLKDHPLYPMFLGGLYSLFGDSFVTVLVAQSILGAGVCVLIYLMTEDIFTKKTAFLAGMISAFYPIFVKLSNLLLSEGLYIFLFTGVLWAFIKYLKTNRSLFAGLTGLLLGLAVLTRSVVILFIFPLVFYMLFLHIEIGLKRRLKNIVLCCMLFALTILPWTARNYHVTGGSIIPVTEAPDRGVYCSFSPYKGKIFGIRPDDDPVLVQARKIESYAERRKFFLSKTLELIKSNPRHIIKIQILKIGYLWSPISWEILGGGQARFNFGFVFILPFFIYGFFKLCMSKVKEKWILLFSIIYFQAIHFVFFALPRFRISMLPSIIMIASFGLRDLYEKVTRKILFTVCVGGYLVFNVLLFIYSDHAKIFLRDLCKTIGVW